eukprot:6508368-Prymnesium_polylepis.1
MVYGTHGGCGNGQRTGTITGEDTGPDRTPTSTTQAGHCVHDNRNLCSLYCTCMLLFEAWAQARRLYGRYRSARLPGVCPDARCTTEYRTRYNEIVQRGLEIRSVTWACRVVLVAEWTSSTTRRRRGWEGSEDL